MDYTAQLSTLTRWNLVNRLTKELWTAWSGRYLQSLAARSKWHKKTYNYKPGDVVLVKDELLKQRHWPLARVLQVYPGDDGLVRTVDLLCQGKTYHRATNRLILIVEDQPAPPSMSGSPQTEKETSRSQ